MAIGSRKGTAATVIGILIFALIVASFYIAMFPKRAIAGADSMGKEVNKVNKSITDSLYEEIFGRQGRSSCTGTYTKLENEIQVSTCKESTCEQNAECICTTTGECTVRNPGTGAGSCSSIGGVCTDSTDCSTKYNSTDAGAKDCTGGLVCCKKCASLGGVCRSNCPTADLMDPVKTYWCSYGSPGYNCCKKTG